MLTSPSIAAAGWYRDPRDRKGVRFHDGSRWTDRSQPGADRLLASRPPSRPRAEMTRGELLHRQTISRWSWLGQEVDTYL